MVGAYHICNCQQAEDEELQAVREDIAHALELLYEALPYVLRRLGASLRRSIGDDDGRIGVLLVDEGEHFEGQLRGRRAVELCNLVQDLYGFGFPASGKQELGRLVEGENEEAEEEDEQRDAAEDDDEVSPTHVARNGAAFFASTDGFARGELGTAAVLCGSAVGDTRGGDDTDGLPKGEEGDQVALGLGEEFQGDGRIDRDVAAETETGEEVDSAYGFIIVLWRSLRKREWCDQFQA